MGHGVRSGGEGIFMVGLGGERGGGFRAACKPWVKETRGREAPALVISFRRG